MTYPPTPHAIGTTPTSDVITYTTGSGNKLLGKSFNGVAYSSFTYDASNRVRTSQHAGDVETTTFDYGSGWTRVTNALGRATAFTFDANQEESGTSGEVSTYCPATATSIERSPGRVLETW